MSSDKNNDERLQMGFAGELSAGKSKKAAWQAQKDNLLLDPSALEVLRNLFEYDPQAKQDSLKYWSDYDLNPPWWGLLQRQRYKILTEEFPQSKLGKYTPALFNPAPHLELQLCKAAKTDQRSADQLKHVPLRAKLDLLLRRLL